MTGPHSVRPWWSRREFLKSGGAAAAGTITIIATDARGASNSTLFHVRLFNQIVH